MFKEERKELMFDWSMLGKVDVGRPNMGNLVDVSVYRLMQFTLRDVLIKELTPERSEKIFYEAGKQAGTHFCRQLLDTGKDLNDFIASVQDTLKKMRIGILRVEKSDVDNMNFILTVAEDLDCSGLPVSDETICTYDEGFLSGLLGEYTHSELIVTEVDCWCSGGRICRFEVNKA